MMGHSTRRIPDEAIAAHFWSKVSQGPCCWEWQGFRNARRNHYGQFAVHRRPMPAHRFAYELTYGPIPDGLFVIHLCDNPPCCRPSHLRLGTPADNTRDMLAKHRHRRGEQLSYSRLTDAQAVQLRRLYGHIVRFPPGMRSTIAAALGVRPSVISDAKAGRTYLLAEMDVEATQ